MLLFDRRGEGQSDGDPNIFGWQGERDIHAAVKYLQTRSEVDPQRIGGIGLSVGGEMMIEAAAESKALKAIVAEGASGRSVFDDFTNSAAGWQAYLGDGVVTAATALFTDNLPPATLKSLVPKVSAPAFFVYGENGQVDGRTRQQGILQHRSWSEGVVEGSRVETHGRCRRATARIRAPHRPFLRPPSVDTEGI